MIKKVLNQKGILDLELLNSIGHNYIFNNDPINRFQNKINNNKKLLDKRIKKLDDLKKKINSIDDCNLKKNSKQIVFADGNIESKIMIVGEGPGQKEDEMGKPFVGDAGILLDKMLEAIKINRKNIYITNVVNFRPPNNRKPESLEITKYSNYLKEHIAIINPKILILMGSTAMEALFGSKIKISKERGKWKEVIVHNKSYLAFITFHPAYLLRQPDQKKYSWLDLKIIRKKIDELKVLV
tara:strand:- start:728 stop:1447 length:720 start_codon:yes stop_codon:yes gene_type:complete